MKIFLWEYLTHKFFTRYFLQDYCFHEINDIEFQKGKAGFAKSKHRGKDIQGMKRSRLVCIDCKYNNQRNNQDHVENKMIDHAAYYN